MKVTITETTVISYEIDVSLANSALEAARLARAKFRDALDPTEFHHSVIQNSLEYTLFNGTQTIADHEADS